MALAIAAAAQRISAGRHLPRLRRDGRVVGVEPRSTRLARVEAIRALPDARGAVWPDLVAQARVGAERLRHAVAGRQALGVRSRIVQRGASGARTKRVPG